MRKEFALSIVLAVGIVSAVLWLAGKSLPPMALQKQAAPEIKGTHPGENSPTNSGKIASGGRAEQKSPSENGIFKCTMHVKTVYSNQGCPEGQNGTAVEIHDAAGIISPPKENLAELTAKRKRAEQVHALQARQQATSLEPSQSWECAELDKRIANLDAMARQPQSASRQDWIRSQRKAARDRQFAIRCQ